MHTPLMPVLDWREPTDLVLLELLPAAVRIVAGAVLRVLPLSAVLLRLAEGWSPCCRLTVPLSQAAAQTSPSSLSMAVVASI
jgi:hypothetical protein